MQDGDGVRLEAESVQEREAVAGRERGNPLAALQQTIVEEWRRIAPGGESSRVRREIRRSQKAERRLQERRRRKERWLARRRRRQLANIERQLLGVPARRFGLSLPLWGREDDAEPGTTELDARIGRVVESALERELERVRRELEQTLDLRIRQVMETMERRQSESERRIRGQNEQSITVVSEQAERSINRVNAEMWRSLDLRLRRETERIEKEVERSVGVEMGRMYLRLSRASEGEVLRGRRR